MSEVITDRKVFSLSEVLLSVQKTLTRRYTSAFWVKAEMNKLNYYKHSGHCYPDLVDKKDGRIVAEIRAVIWNSDYTRINQKFLTILKEPLKDGIKILLCARIQFDPKYGLSLHISDIDPSYTLGDLEREKQDTLIRLKAEKIFDQNKKLTLPLLPQRIAVISVETSKGYADFLNITSGNPWRYKFFHFLFPSLLQGDRAASSIIVQLNNIRKAIPYFDAVAIIRGGGGEVGLTCYNDYNLAKAICEFPIPVITGIGHSTNETVSELVAHTNAITPTKLGEFLIQHFHNFSIPVKEAEEKIAEESLLLLSDNKTAVFNTAKLFRSAAERSLLTHKNNITNLLQSLNQQTRTSISEAREQLRVARREIDFSTTHTLFVRRNEIKDVGQAIEKNTSFLSFKAGEKLNAACKSIGLFSSLLLKDSRNLLTSLENNIRILHPENILKRGYSITLFENKAVTDIRRLKKGDGIRTITAGGSIDSIVSKTILNPKKNEQTQLPTSF